MPAEVVTETGHIPRRARYLVPRDLPRRGEVIAAFALIAVLAHLLLAQLTLAFAVVFYLVTRATRWRPSWLAGPVLAGLAWAVIIGPSTAVDGLLAGPQAVIGYFDANGHQAQHLLHIGGAFAGTKHWLPRQLPLAAVLGAAEAAVAGWLRWLHTDEWKVRPARPGLVVVARRMAAVRAIRAGGVLTRDGGCLGVAPASGSRVALSWREASGGVLVCGSSWPDPLATSFQLIHAAVRLRKPVLAVDLTGDPDLAGRLAAACASAGAPLRLFGGSTRIPGGLAPSLARPSGYEPFRAGDPARRASLVMAMLSWDGPSQQYRHSCTAYLTDIFELIDNAPGDARVSVLDEVIHLLNPAAMRARMRLVPTLHPRHAALAERVRMSASLIEAEPAATVGLVQHLRGLRASPFGRWLCTSADQIDLRRTVTQREVALFSLGTGARLRPSAQAGAGFPVVSLDAGARLPAGESGRRGPEALPDPVGTDMLARLICQDLKDLGAELHARGLDGDGIIWLAECEPLPRQAVADLILGGPGAGMTAIAATTSERAAAELAGYPNALVVHRLRDPDAAGQIAAAASRGSQHGGRGQPVTGPDLCGLDTGFVLAVNEPRQRLVPLGMTVRARIPSARQGRPSASRGTG